MLCQRWQIHYLKKRGSQCGRGLSLIILGVFFKLQNIQRTKIIYQIFKKNLKENFKSLSDGFQVHV